MKRVEAARRAARRKSLLHPLQRVAGDFRLRVRRGLHARGHGDLQPAHAAVIVHLRTEGSRLTDLARRAGMSKQAMGKLVDELERIGYVERRPDPGDGRAKLVRFSEAGLGLLRDSGRVVDEIWDAYAGVLGEARLTRLRDSLDRLVEGLGELEPVDGGDHDDGARR